MSSVAELLESLQERAAYRHLPLEQLSGPVLVKQTHLSLVFLTDKDVFKLKKPVAFSFVDFRSLQSRKKACEDEIRLNRRLAPSVYLDVLPIVRCRDSGEILLVPATYEADGMVVIEYAVHMRRLLDESTLLAQVRAHTVRPETVESIAELLAKFHRSAERSDEISSFGSVSVISRNVMENFSETVTHKPEMVSNEVYDLVREKSLQMLEELAPEFQRRVDEGAVCDAHGDLRLEHVYIIGNTILVIDCIEFSDRFRYSDALSDASFLYMDLCKEARYDLAERFLRAYMSASNTPLSGADTRLLLFYAAYRSVVRAKVSGMKARDESVTTRPQARMKAASHWLLALSLLSSPSTRPALLLVGGLPGTGKSTVSKMVVGESKACWIRSDEVRKELFPKTDSSERCEIGRGLYSPSVSAATYAECLRRALQALSHANRVVVDATFLKSELWKEFLRAGEAAGVPVLMINCVCDRDIIRSRLADRKNDISDADFNVYEALEDPYLRAGKQEMADDRRVEELNTESSPERVKEALHFILQRHCLLD